MMTIVPGDHHSIWPASTTYHPTATWLAAIACATPIGGATRVVMLAGPIRVWRDVEPLWWRDPANPNRLDAWTTIACAPVAGGRVRCASERLHLWHYERPVEPRYEWERVFRSWSDDIGRFTGHWLAVFPHVSHFEYTAPLFESGALRASNSVFGVPVSSLAGLLIAEQLTVAPVLLARYGHGHDTGESRYTRGVRRFTTPPTNRVPPSQRVSVRNGDVFTLCNDTDAPKRFTITLDFGDQVSAQERDRQIRRLTRALRPRDARLSPPFDASVE